MKLLLFVLCFCCFFHFQSNSQIRPAHVVIALFENHSYQEILNNPSAPYINSLFNDKNSAVFTQSFALTHPSQPNYLMLYSGANQGVTTDNLPPNLPFTTLNLGSSLLQQNFTFTGYSESMPSEGYNGETSSSYARKHNPWVNWQNASANGIPSASNKPFTSFPTDYNTLPTVSFVVPNLNNDMHDGSIATGDAWIQNNLNAYIQWCKNNNSLFIITFDEDDASANNQIATVITGQNVQGGAYAQRITHYNVLRTIEDLYGLPYEGTSSDSSSIRDIWKQNTLAIDLLNFDAIEKGNLNLLNWGISKDANVASFEVQKSINGQSFVSIGSVPVVAGADHYNYTDKNAVKQLNFYRLKMIGDDGNFSISAVKTVNNKPTFTAKIFPNPVTNVISVSIEGGSDNDVEIYVTTMDGIVLTRKNIKGSSSILTPSVNVSNLATGNFLITVKQDGIQQSIKFLKQ